MVQTLAAKSAHAPFCDTKLTALLQDSLSSNAKALLVMCVARKVGASEHLHRDAISGVWKTDKRQAQGRLAQ